METINYELKIDRSKINANFDGYKLSLDFLPISSVEFPNNIDVAKLSSENYTYQYIKLFGLHNALYHDHFNPDNVYFVDDHWQILQTNLIPPMNISLTHPTPVITIPNCSEKILAPNRVPITMHFTNESYVVVTDGVGTLFIFKTGTRKEISVWKEVYKGDPLGSNIDAMISYSSYHVEHQTCFIEVICLHVLKSGDKDTGEDGRKLGGSSKHLADHYAVYINWLSFSSDDDMTFKLARQRSFRSASVPEYLCLNKEASTLLVACERPVKIIFDSLRPIAEENGHSKEALVDEANYAYTWSQNAEEIAMYFKLPAGTSKSQILCDVRKNSLSVRLIGSEVPLICGDLLDEVVVNDCIWTIDNNFILEITLHKLNHDFDWPLVVKEDMRGERIFDADQIDLINNRLAPYTSDELIDVKACGDDKPAFNVQQIEECDAYPDYCCAIYCFDGETHKITQQIDLSSHQFLFSNRYGHHCDDLPSLCLRHDVDGIVWRPIFQDSNCRWIHDATFDAFGYVQASKQQKKFTMCSPDFSYISIIDCQRHAYIYRRATPIASPLRNRKTGETVATVAKQQVVSLETSELIEGAVATNSRLFLIVGHSLFSILVHPAEQ